jgi:hypothetical protein
MKVAKICGYAFGVAYLILLVLGGPTMWILGLAVVLAPLTLALALSLTAILAAWVHLLRAPRSGPAAR